MSAHLLAGEAFVAAFKREPTSPADSAWMNGYEAACSSAGARDTKVDKP